jgi:CcmD family protein
MNISRSKLFNFIVVLLLWLPQVAFGQEEVDMAVNMRADGKIYVVVVVAAIVMTGILVYLFFLDRKISRLEEKLRQHNQK